MVKTIIDYTRDRVTGRDDLDLSRVILVDSCRTPGLVDAAREALREFGGFREVVETQAGCTIFCHCGPDALGVMFCRKKPE